VYRIMATGPAREVVRAPPPAAGPLLPLCVMNHMPGVKIWKPGHVPAGLG